MENNFKGTQNKVFYCEKTKGIKADGINGLLATAWSVYNAEEVENRLDGESWLDMRKRTESIRIEKSLQTEANAELITDAFNIRQQINFDLPELLERYNKAVELLQYVRDCHIGDKIKLTYGINKEIKQFLKTIENEK